MNHKKLKLTTLYKLNKVFYNKMFTLNIDILYIITEFLTISNQINLKKINKYHYNNLKIICFGINYYNKTMTQEIINKFPDLRKLYMTDSLYSLNLNHLSNLSFLKIDGLCSIGHEDICNLKHIKYLDVSYNFNVKQLPDCDIRILHINGKSCQISDNNIKDLNLEELHCCFNNNITKIAHFKNLEKLTISKDSPINLNDTKYLPKLTSSKIVII